MKDIIEHLWHVLIAMRKAPASVLTPQGLGEIVQPTLLSIGITAPIIGPPGPSNSSTVLDVGNSASLWLSDFANLATIFNEHLLDPQRLKLLQDTLNSLGWTYVPESLASLKIRENQAYTWFSELFGEY